MSIDMCTRCEKRLDTDFVEYQPDGLLYCDNCLDAMDDAELVQAASESMDWLAVAYTGEHQPGMVQERVKSLTVKLAALRGES
jgi:hypothetical protein